MDLLGRYRAATTSSQGYAMRMGGSCVGRESGRRSPAGGAERCGGKEKARAFIRVQPHDLTGANVRHSLLASPGGKHNI